MARLHEYNDPNSEHPDIQGRCSSIYATFTLARLVHNFISRVKADLHSRQRSNKPSLDVLTLGSYNLSVHSKSGSQSDDSTEVSTPTTISKHSGLQQHVGDSIDRHCVSRRGLASKSSSIQ